MSYIQVGENDNTWETLKKGFNLRWPESKEDSAKNICICRSADEIVAAATDAHKANKRITIRSGGHCYEGFVSNRTFKGNSRPNEDLTIIDISLMTGLEYSPDGNIPSDFDPSFNHYKFKASAGNQNWDGYIGLYKTAGKTVPGGSCYSVGAGGHVTGGGYGLLSRKHGLTVDWVSGIDVITPDGKGGFIKRHVSNTSASQQDCDLFAALCGAGGGNFGIITNYYYNELPDAPKTAALVQLSWSWDNIKDANTLNKFLNAYYGWFADNDKNWNSSDPQINNGGLFTLLKLQHQQTGSINLLIQYTGIDGTYTPGVNDAPLLDFIKTMNASTDNKLHISQSFPMTSVYGPSKSVAEDNTSVAAFFNAEETIRDMDWLYLTQSINGSGDNQYGKYKSVYQKGAFTPAIASALYQYLTTTDPRLNQALIQIDSYGGCINHLDSHQNQLTSVSQRNSLLKWQLQVYWKDQNDEAACVKWIRDIFKACFNAYGGKPYQTWQNKETPFEGCYINYPDIDMKYLDDAHNSIDSNWLTLYYGNTLPARLIQVKYTVDPENIFRHEMSIPVTNLSD